MTPKNAPMKEKEYILVITDGRNDLRLAARYLQGRFKAKEKNKRSPPNVVECDDISSAIQFYREHPFSIPLVVADESDPYSTGARFLFVQSSIEHPAFTNVADAYTMITREGGIYRVREIDLESFGKTIDLQLRGMRLRRRISSEYISRDLNALAENRRGTLDRILLEHGDYIFYKKPSESVTKALKLLNKPHNWIAAALRPLRAGDFDTASSVWNIIEDGIMLADPLDIAIIGEDQSMGGGYLIDDLSSVRPDLPVDGFKRTKTYLDAHALKEVADFYAKLEHENSRNAANSKGGIESLWQIAKLNGPEILDILAAQKGGIVFMRNRGFTICPIGTLKPYPNLLQDAAEMKASLDTLVSSMGSQLLDATLIGASQKLGFWRANPHSKVDHGGAVQERRNYYTTHETMFFEQVGNVFGKTKEADIKIVRDFFGYINNWLNPLPEDMGLRLDLRVEHLGYDIPGKHLPKAQDVIDAIKQNASSIDYRRAYNYQVIYDIDGSTIVVPLHHELSHYKEHPILSMDMREAQRYTAAALAYQTAFGLLKEGREREAMIWYEAVKLLEADKGIPSILNTLLYASFQGFSEFGKNELLIDIYRDLDEARQILTIRLPRLYTRPSATPSWQSETSAKTISVRKDHYTHYVTRALQHLDELQYYFVLPDKQLYNLAAINDMLNQMKTIKDVPFNRVTFL